MARGALTAALWAAVACTPLPYRTAPGWDEPIASWDGCSDRARNCPRWAPYQRISDDQWGQIYWLVSSVGNACEVSPATFTLARTGERFTCQWRRPRP